VTVDAFNAVSDERRRAILELLRTGERTAGEIARTFRDISWPAVSRHLRLLKEAGLVSERKRGRERVYTLEAARIRDVFGSWVAAFDTMWQHNLESLKRELEEDTP
jgi:DNA-binding transcriptional ArsR family regulator